MRFRLHETTLHVHDCPEHSAPCDFFDHAPEWLVGNRDAARDQLMIYRRSVVARISALTLILASIDAMLHRLEMIHV